MAKTLCDSIRLTSFINLFACFAIMALAEPIIRILFQHGRFLPSDTIATAMALRAYATGLLFFCLVKVMGPAFYALDNTRIPVFASIVSVVVNIVLNLALIGPLGYWGLALGTGIAAIFNAGILYLKLDARLGGFKKFGLKKALMGILFATGISGAFIYWLQNFATAQIALKWPELVGGLMVTILVTAFSMVAGTLLLFLIAYLLKIEEATKAKALIARRLFAKKNKET
jgi:putative peptidoglycan lipid II flippase